MRDKDLYAKILGIESPWAVTDVDLSVEDGEVKVKVETEPGTKLTCPKCGKECPG
jgi:transposase